MIGEEEKEEAEEARADGGGCAGGGAPFFSPQMGIAGLEGNGYLCRKFLKQSFFYEITFPFCAGGLARCIVCQRC